MVDVERESDGLPPPVAKRLNDAFYRVSPHRYFELRLLSLLAIDSLPADANEHHLPTSTLTDKVLGGEIEFDPELLSRGEIETYVAAEAQVLLHHVGEVLVRFVLGHLGFPRCPWLEISALSEFRAFKNMVRSLVDTDRDDLERRIDGLLFGESPAADDARREFIAVATETVVAAARRVLDDSPLYNAAKHGFAVLSDRTAVEFRIEPPDDESADDRAQREAVEKWMSDKGLTLESLEWIYDKRTKVRQWRTAVRFVDPGHDLALAWLTIRVLSNVWRITKTRYAGGGPVEVLHGRSRGVSSRATPAQYAQGHNHPDSGNSHADARRSGRRGAPKITTILASGGGSGRGVRLLGHHGVPTQPPHGAAYRRNLVGVAGHIAAAERSTPLPVA